MTDISKCPICGKEMTVVGNTTLHYECLECVKKSEELINKIFLIGNMKADGSRNYYEMVADFILIREKELLSRKRETCLACNDSIWDMKCSVYKREEELRADERKLVAEEICSKMYDTDWCAGTMDDVCCEEGCPIREIITNAQLGETPRSSVNEKKVDG